MPSLLRQSPVQGNRPVADKLATVAKLLEFNPGEVLIQQDADDNDIFFILDGRVSVLVNGNQVAERTGNQHVGEMALIDPVGRRSATVTATSLTTVAKVSAEQFIPIANEWAQMSRDRPLLA